MKIRPIHGPILAERIAEKEQTPGGLIIPDTAKEKLSKRWLSPSAAGPGGPVGIGETGPVGIPVVVTCHAQ